MSNVVFPNYLRGITWPVKQQIGFDTIVQRGQNAYETRLNQITNPVWQFELIFDYIKDNPNDLIPGQSYTDLQILKGFVASNYGKWLDWLYTDPYDCNVGPAILSAAPNLMTELQVVNEGVIYYSPVQRTIGGQFMEDITDLAAVVSWSNLATTGAGSFTLTSSSNTFTPYMVDQSITISSGTNFVAGWYQIASYVNSGTVILSASPSPSGAGSSGVGSLGGIVVYANGVLQTGGGVNYSLSTTPGLAIPGYSFMGQYLTWTSAPAAPVTAQFSFYYRVRFDDDSYDWEQFTPNLWTIGGSQSKNGKGYLSFSTSRPATT